MSGKGAPSGAMGTGSKASIGKREAKEPEDMDNAGGLDDEVEEVRMIVLLSSDKQRFRIALRCAIISRLIKEVIESDKSADEVPVNVSGKALSCIVKYMEVHKGVDMKAIETPIKHKTMAEICGSERKWEAQWIDKISKHRRNFYEILHAANYLDIPGIISLGVCRLASWLKYCPNEDVDRVLDPDITDGKLLPMRDFGTWSADSVAAAASDGKRSRLASDAKQDPVDGPGGEEIKRPSVGGSGSSSTPAGAVKSAAGPGSAGNGLSIARSEPDQSAGPGQGGTSKGVSPSK